MTDEQRKLTNERCLEFVHTHVLVPDLLDAFASLRNTFTEMGVREITRLSEITGFLPSDLILGYGFGIDKLTVSDLDALMKEESEGCALAKVAVAA